MERKYDILKRWSVYLAGVVVLLHIVVPHHHHYNGVADFQHHIEQTKATHDMDFSSEIYHCDALDTIILDSSYRYDRDWSIATTAFFIVLWSYHQIELSLDSTITEYYCIDTRIVDRYIVSSLSHRGPPALLS